MAAQVFADAVAVAPRLVEAAPADVDTVCLAIPARTLYANDEAKERRVGVAWRRKLRW